MDKYKNLFNIKLSKYQKMFQRNINTTSLYSDFFVELKFTHVYNKCDKSKTTVMW